VSLATLFTAANAKGITVVGPLGGNNAPGNATVKCGNQQKTVAIVQQLTMATVTESDHITGGKTLTVDPAALPGNCYWLPWNSWRAYVGQLGGASDYFVTANLTGCGFYVSGPRANPYVVHANCSAAEVVDFGGNVKTYTDDLEAARMQFYGQLGAELVEQHVIPSAGLQMLRPEDYGAKSAQGYATPVSVFGRRTGGNWTIYYSVGGRAGSALTRMLYPDFERL